MLTCIPLNTAATFEKEKAVATLYSYRKDLFFLFIFFPRENCTFFDWFVVYYHYRIDVVEFIAVIRFRKTNKTYSNTNPISLSFSQRPSSSKLRSDSRRRLSWKLNTTSSAIFSKISLLSMWLVGIPLTF